MKRWVVGFAVAYFVLMLAAVTFPGLGLVNSVEPLVFGLPFVFAWVGGWVAGALVVFFMIYRALSRPE